MKFFFDDPYFFNTVFNNILVRVIVESLRKMWCRYDCTTGLACVPDYL